MRLPTPPRGSLWHKQQNLTTAVSSTWHRAVVSRALLTFREFFFLFFFFHYSRPVSVVSGSEIGTGNNGPQNAGLWMQQNPLQMNNQAFSSAE